MATVSETLASLRAALSAVQDAYKSIPTDVQPYDYRLSNMRWELESLSTTLKGLVRDKWIDSQAFPTVEGVVGYPSSVTEAGAKFSSATKQAILGIADALKGLIGHEPTDEDKEALSAAVDEVVGQVETIIARIDAARVAHESQGATMRFEGSTLFVTEGTDPSKNQYRMLVIKEGLSGNRNGWKGPVLQASANLLEGRPIYLNHAAGAEKGQPAPRSIADKVGWWSDVEYKEGVKVGEQQINGIFATANLLESSAHPWLPGMIREAIQKGQPNIIGVSVDAQVAGVVKRGADNKLFRDIESILAYTSADIVAEPGAGGQPLAVLEGLYSDEEIMELENLNIEGLRTARPDLYESIVAQAREGQPPAQTQEAQPPVVETPPAPATPPEPDTRITEALTQMETATNALRLREQSLVLEAALTNSGLPAPVCEVIRAEIGDNVVTQEQMAAVIDRYVGVARAVATESISLTAQTLVPFHGVNMGESVSPLDQVIASLDDWFGNPNPEMKGKYNTIESMKSFYVAVTGDSSGGVDGVYNAKESVIGRYLGMSVQEALPSQALIIGGPTITLPYLFGLSMNRMLTKKYRGQDLWWQPIVAKKRLNNFKEQSRIRLHSFGSLTQRPNGTEEYTELSWAETEESYTPTGYGNLVPVARRAFINDDLEGLRRIPTLLAESAAYTINEVVANLFLANSGAGVTLDSDSKAVFHNDHQANLMSQALSKGSLTTAIKIAGGMTNDAGKRIGWKLSNLLVPIDLVDTAYEITASDRVPGSANNEPNFIKSKWGVSQDGVIVVPQFTDANNWYGMASPDDIELIEVGFILGREDPEFFIQNGGTEGMVFTHDTINYKVRHEYGADWNDYRGAVGSVVA